MKSIISKLYYGEINPCEKPAQDTERYNENLDKISGIEQKLLDSFPGCKELLDDYTGVLHILSQLECEANFISGFKLGAQFAEEIYKSDDV